ncbi:MAG: hypothetical protein HC935_04430, partial [Pseudanabaena sp. SU_2_4]|nr:hypothetical protein [Pseudanabaena sp. SU_2_4]
SASPSGIFTTSFGVGNAGDLTVQTKGLSVTGGGEIAASAATVGNAGNIHVTATDTIELIGKSANQFFPSGILAQSVGNGNAGNLRVSADRIIVKDGAIITAAGEATGSSGNLDVASRFLRLENGGKITASSSSRTGGNISLQAEDLQVLRGGSISASAAQFGNGGNLNINAQTFVALDNSSLSATAFQGRGGNIQINTQGLFRSDASVISASSLLGIDGILEIKTPELNLQNSLAPIAITFTNPNSLIADSCLTRRNGGSGSFVITGTGGLPRSPYDDKVASRYYVADLQGQSVNSEIESIQNHYSNTSNQVQVEIPISNHISQKAKYPIQEAQSLTVSPAGRILLTTLPQQGNINSANLVCP